MTTTEDRTAEDVAAGQPGPIEYLEQLEQRILAGESVTAAQLGKARDAAALAELQAVASARAADDEAAAQLDAARRALREDQAPALAEHLAQLQAWHLEAVRLIHTGGELANAYEACRSELERSARRLEVDDLTVDVTRRIKLDRIVELLPAEAATASHPAAYRRLPWHSDTFAQERADLVERRAAERAAASARRQAEQTDADLSPEARAVREENERERSLHGNPRSARPAALSERAETAFEEHRRSVEEKHRASDRRSIEQLEQVQEEALQRHRGRQAEADEATDHLVSDGPADHDGHTIDLGSSGAGPSDGGDTAA